MLELQTFGGLELRRAGGDRIEALAGHTKRLALLAYLAVEACGERVPREQVAALLWSDRTDERARNSLRVALSRIRHATDPTVLGGAGEPSVWLVRDHVRPDVVGFREALDAGDHARALELYRGDFLAGVRVEGASRFRRWRDERRGEYRRRAYEAALSLGAEARQASDLASAEVAFRTALDLAPLREEAAEKLIRTLADRGRTADAVRLYEAFGRRRRDELDLTPSPELEELVERMKRAPTGGRPEGDPGS